MTPGQLADKKIVIFSHYATTGACEELRDWLRGLKIRELVYVAFHEAEPFNRIFRCHARVRRMALERE